MKISEIFASFQGEGRFTGTLSVWIRFFGCNLNCSGFGQKNPTTPETYEIPYRDIDLTGIKSLEELPVFSKGCDSSYSWAPKFKHLSKNYTLDEIVEELFRLQREKLKIPENDWFHPKTSNLVQLCFTGGEPMLHQKEMMLILKKLLEMNNRPPQITIETNGTKICKVDFSKYTDLLHFSCSPKLYSVSGEKDVIKPDVIKQYSHFTDSGTIKFVVNGTKECWEELDYWVDRIYPLPYEWNMMIMPVGSDLESQNIDYIGPIVEEGLKRGFGISMRTQIQAFGNLIGT